MQKKGGQSSQDNKSYRNHSLGPPPRQHQKHYSKEKMLFHNPAKIRKCHRWSINKVREITLKKKTIGRPKIGVAIRPGLKKKKSWVPGESRKWH